MILKGLWLNLRVLVVCSVIIMVFGLLLALARTSKSPVLMPVRLFAAGFTDLFRGLPLLLVILLLGLGVPGLRLQGIPNSVVFFGGMALVLTYSAYVAEVLRAGDGRALDKLLDADGRGGVSRLERARLGLFFGRGFGLLVVRVRGEREARDAEHHRRGERRDATTHIRLHA